MNKVAIAFLTKDRVELSRRSVEPLLQPSKFDLFWVDGSASEKGRELPLNYTNSHIHADVRGGAGAAIVFALTTMLAKGYDYVGLCENDVLCAADWFDRAFALFAAGNRDGLRVGAVSARCYADRVLFQRDGYAVCHNLGAGLILFERNAARLVLDHFRSGWTTDNRRVFCQLSGVDIGPFWAFKAGDHALVADWHFDTVLAAHGYCSLALTPSPVEMIGQDPLLAEQGLTIVKEPMTERIDEHHFKWYRNNLACVNNGEMRINVETKFQYDATANSWTYLPHQLHMINGMWECAPWKFKEARAFGEFVWVSQFEGNEFMVPAYGNAMLLMSGGKTGGAVHVIDESSGYEVEPYIAPEGANQQCIQIPLPATVAMRTIRVTCKTPGICFYRLVTKERQPDDPTQGFDHSYLPEPV